GAIYPMLITLGSRSTDQQARESQLLQFLIRSGLARPESEIRVSILPGGVSCDVWRIETHDRTICVKRALPRLRVAKLWEAPVARSEAEWNWLNFVKGVVPEAV